MNRRLEEEKVLLEKELELLKESLESDIITGEEYNQKKEIIEKKLNELETKIKEAEKEEKLKRTEKETEIKEAKTEEIKKEEQKKNKKYKYILVPLIIILLAISLSIYLRIQPAYLPITDEWATIAVHNSLKSQIKKQIDLIYPNLPEADKNILFDTEFQKSLEQQKSEIEQRIKQDSAYVKSRLQNDKGQTYLLAIDPYFWMRQAKNIIEHGYPGDEIRDGVQYDNHMIAPIGRPNPGDTFHPYLEAYLFKFLRLFNKDLDLMKVVFYVPILISALAIIPAFFIARKIGGNFAGAIAAVIVAIHPAFLNRTAGGFADTDAYNVLFPLLIVWLFLEAFESKNIKKSVILIGLSGFFVGLYSFTWIGWWFIFDFILASLIVYFVCYILVHRNDLKKGIINFIKQPAIKTLLVITIVFLLSSLIFVTAFRDYSIFKEAPTTPLQFTKIKEIGISKVWPNVLTTVGEQDVASLNEIISHIGGKFLFLIALIGITLMMIRKETKKKGDLLFILFSIIWFLILLNIQFQNLIMFLVLLSLPIIIKFILIIKEGEAKIDIKTAVLLIMWFVATIYASIKGVRWVLLLVPAFGVAFGVALGYLYRYLSGAVIKELKINRIIAKTIIVVLLCLLLIGPWNSAKSLARVEIPDINDAWWDSIEKIKFDSEPNAIITSWWDFGHWFKAIADRPVTFDGTSQDRSQAHWVGNILSTNDEEVAISVLRMLDCGANNAYDELIKTIDDTAKSVGILYKIMMLNKKDAEKVLSEYDLNSEEINLILEYTHCKPPENYFIVSEDMVSKAHVWAHFGFWNFDKAQAYYALNKKEYKNNKEASINYLKERFGYEENEANNVYDKVISLVSSSDVDNWVAPWPSYASSGPCDKQDEFNLICHNGIRVDLKNNEMFTITENQEKLYPRSFAIPTKDGNLIVKEHNESFLILQNGMPLGAVLIPEGNNSYNLLLMHYTLTGSMFTRLFYMDGHGLKHFKKFSDERSVFGERIIIYKVDWESSEKNIMEYFKTFKENGEDRGKEE